MKNVSRMINTALRPLLVATTLITMPLVHADSATPASDTHAQVFGADTLDRSYRRLLPLEGGSNFRDLGGYPTTDGKRVVRGQLFRSGAPTSLTADDMQYLSRFHFKTAVDLRSNEERELFPNRWVQADSTIAYKYLDYSIMEPMGRMKGEGKRPGMDQLYRGFPTQIAPQLKMYFNALLQHETPAVVNCSAGQDRTGFTSALVLSVLGVPRDTVIEDYLLSTDFRRPDREMGDVDLERASDTNAFAKMMLAYRKQGASNRPNPLVTEDGVPFIVFALDQIDSDYGSVEGYLKQALGLTDKDVARLRELYLVDQAS